MLIKMPYSIRFKFERQHNIKANKDAHTRRLTGIKSRRSSTKFCVPNIYVKAIANEVTKRRRYSFSLKNGYISLVYSK